MDSSPVSVVVPARNAGPFVEEALRSALAQSPLEVIVAEDGSTDETPEVLRRFADSIRVIRTGGAGAAAARNAAMREARGEWIAFLDADDAWEPGKLEAQLAASSGTRLVFTGVVGGRPLPRPSFESLLADNYICTSSVMARREDLLALGGFREHLRIAHDYDLWLRFLRERPALGLDRPLVRYRTHPAGISQDAAATLLETLEVLAPWNVPRTRLERLHRALGHAWLERGRWREARGAFLAAIMAHPGSPLSWAWLAASACGPLGAGAAKRLARLKCCANR